MAQHKAMQIAAPKLQKLLGKEPDKVTLWEAVTHESAQSLPAQPKDDAAPVSTLRLAPGQFAWQGTPVACRGASPWRSSRGRVSPYTGEVGSLASQGRVPAHSCGLQALPDGSRP
eukprot:4552845-Amphidinium_carterae.1